MSRATERATELVAESKFNFINNKTLEVRDAVIIWPNFRGETNKFGNSARTFNLVINREMAEKLRGDGWTVRVIENEDSDPMYFVNIKVKLESAYPPAITLFTDYNGKKAKQSLETGDEVAMLDRIHIKSADCMINAYSSKAFPDKVSGYLTKLNIIQEPDIEFGGKYDEWDNQPTSDDDLPF